MGIIKVVLVVVIIIILFHIIASLYTCRGVVYNKLWRATPEFSKQSEIEDMYLYLSCPGVIFPGKGMVLIINEGDVAVEKVLSVTAAPLTHNSGVINLSGFDEMKGTFYWSISGGALEIRGDGELKFRGYSI